MIMKRLHHTAHKIGEFIIPSREYILASTRWRKLFWLVIIMFCTLMLVAQTAYIMIEFYDYESIKTDRITTEKPPFPLVELCSDLPFHPGSMIELANSLQSDPTTITDLLVSMSATQSEIMERTMDRDDNKMEQAYGQLVKKAGNSSRILKYLMNFALTCDSILSRCAIQDDVFDCCKYVTKRYVHQNALCFQLDVKNMSANQVVAGNRGGLRITLERDTKLLRNSASHNALKLPFNYHVHLKARTQEVYSTISHTELLVVPESKATIAMSYHAVQLLGGPYQPVCLQNTTTMITSMNGIQGYNIEDCYSACEAAETWKQCDCVLMGALTNTSDPPICSPARSTQKCATKAKNSANCNCPLACKHIYFQPTLSSYPITGYNLTSQTTNINLYYTVLFGTISTQKPKTSIIALINGIGGVMTFWMGLRVVNFIQISYYIFLILCWGAPVSGKNTPPDVAVYERHPRKDKPRADKQVQEMKNVASSPKPLEIYSRRNGSDVV